MQGRAENLQAVMFYVIFCFFSHVWIVHQLIIIVFNPLIILNYKINLFFSCKLSGAGLFWQNIQITWLLFDLIWFFKYSIPKWPPKFCSE